jgi:hypothetical protein
MAIRRDRTTVPRSRKKGKLRFWCEPSGEGEKATCAVYREQILPGYGVSDKQGQRVLIRRDVRLRQRIFTARFIPGWHEHWGDYIAWRTARSAMRACAALEGVVL